MKDIVITGAKVRRELFILLACFIASCGCNVYAVIHYERPAVELISCIGYVVVFALIIYLVLGILRLLALAVKSIINIIKQ